MTAAGQGDGQRPEEDGQPRAATVRVEETAGEASRAAMEEARERETAREETAATEEDATPRAARAEETAGEASRAATEEARERETAGEETDATEEDAMYRPRWRKRQPGRLPGPRRKRPGPRWTAFHGYSGSPCRASEV